MTSHATVRLWGTDIGYVRLTDDQQIADFESCGKLARLKHGGAKAILTEIQTIVSKWRDYADEVGISPEKRDRIHQVLRLSRFS